LDPSEDAGSAGIEKAGAVEMKVETGIEVMSGMKATKKDVKKIMGTVVNA
jgi:hypothetical protein